MSQRVVIDSVVFAREGALLQGKLPVSDLGRVLDMLNSPAGDLAYRVQGQMERDRPQLLLDVDGELSLVCQRCLGGISYPVRIHSLLELIGNEEELTQEEMEDDSRDFLVAQKELDVVALIEDEILLDFPLVPRHENCVLPALCQPEKVSPFSVLERLKNKA